MYNIYITIARVKVNKFLCNKFVSNKVVTNSVVVSESIVVTGLKAEAASERIVGADRCVCPNSGSVEF